ncbi:MAG: hypothetical protein RLZZ84_1508 [Pseudomonadota bacterium]|jgi:hypothetical protein
MRRLYVLTAAAIAVSAAFAPPALARDALGVFGEWAAFRDAAVPRCYAIAMAAPSMLQRDYQPYADVAWWPRQQLRGQVHFRLSRKLATNAPITLTINGQRFALTGGGGDAWAVDKRGDAAIVAALRSAREMTVSARDASGTGFSNTWQLAGVATAMDAAAVGCAAVR